MSDVVLYRELVALVRRLEWVTDDDDPHVGFCAECGRERDEGHLETCAVGILIARLDDDPDTRRPA